MPILPIFAMIATFFHTPPDLQPLQWHSRVLLVFAVADDDTQLRQQLALLEKDKAGAEERDMRVFAVTGRSTELDELRNRLHCPGDGFAVVLIGKDGGAKLHRTHPVAAGDLFQTIDRMPMRRDEMR